MGRKTRVTPWGKEVGRRLSVAIEKRLKQRDVASQLGVSEGAISTYIAGGVPEAWERLRKLCEVSGASADWLLGVGDTVDAVAEPHGEYLSAGDRELVEEIARRLRSDVREVVRQELKRVGVSSH